MRMIIMLLFLVVATRSAVFAQCPPIQQMYHRAIQPTQYTWGYDGSTLSAQYMDGSLVQPGHVYEGIDQAVSKWTNAANGDGAAITLTETNYNGAQLKVLFRFMAPRPACRQACLLERSDDCCRLLIADWGLRITDCGM